VGGIGLTSGKGRIWALDIALGRMALTHVQSLSNPLIKP
jgi:hypothetical protein